MIRKIIVFLKKLTGRTAAGDAPSCRRLPDDPNRTTDDSQIDRNKRGVANRQARGDSGSEKAIDKAAETRPAPPPVAWRLSDFAIEPVEGKTRFHDLGLPEGLLHAIADLGFQYCTPIQAAILPNTLAGQDATGRAQTGTGKTAAFLIAIITRLLEGNFDRKGRNRTPRSLILAPTRELVLQIADEAVALTKYVNLTIVTVFGGMDYEKQRRQLGRGSLDIVVATPGRLLDFQRKKDIVLDHVEILIIDEADRMLDMGFIPDVRRIIYSTPHKSKRQTLLFSATLTPQVTRLAEQWTTSPIRVEIEPEQVAVNTVQQIVYIVTREDKYALLYNIITGQSLERVLVFCNRKDETRRLDDLFQRYRINCAVLSGDIRQNKRIKTLEDFKAGKIRVLVATDVAGRGIHIDGMDHVINYTLPRDPEDYVHRIGRTGRAGAAGTSISFADEDDSFNIPAIEALIGQTLPCTHPDDTMLKAPQPPARRNPRARSQKGAGEQSKRRRPQQRPRRPGARPQHRRRRSPRPQDAKP